MRAASRDDPGGTVPSGACEGARQTNLRTLLPHRKFLQSTAIAIGSAGSDLAGRGQDRQFYNTISMIYALAVYSDWRANKIGHISNFDEAILPG